MSWVLRNTLIAINFQNCRLIRYIRVPVHFLSFASKGSGHWDLSLFFVSGCPVFLRNVFGQVPD